MSAPTRTQLDALRRLWKLANQSHGAGRVAASLLLGLYNGDRFKFGLTDLRLLDTANLQDALHVLVMDARPQAEVHVLLNREHRRHDFGKRFERLAHFWMLKGRCKKEHLDQVENWVAPEEKRTAGVLG